MASLLEIYQVYPFIILGGALILGLLVGSFLNVVIYRLPLMMQKEWQQECKLLLEIEDDNPNENEKVFNLAVPRSACPKCYTPIKAWQNIPVISYLLLKGRCSHCKTPINLRYPIVEAVTGLLSLFVISHFGPTYLGLAALLFTWALICLTLIDADTQLLPDSITLPLLWLGLIINAIGGFTDLESAVWGAVFGYLSLWSVYWLFKLATGKEGMGFGDFKLLAALGTWMGWQLLPLVILLSSLVGAVIGSLFLMLSKQGKNTAIPFGPYLAIAGWIAFFWGEQIVDHYFKFMGL